MNNTLHIVGAGGHAKVVIDVAKQLGYEQLYLYDDAPGIVGTRVSGTEVVGNTEKIFELIEPANVFIAVGNNQIRKQFINRISTSLYSLVTLVAPSAVVSKSSVLGCGVLVAPNAVINAESQVGIGSVINTSSVVEHDVNIGSFSHIAPKSVVLGSARVGDNCMIGAGSVVLPQVKLSDGVVLGANSTATKDLVAGIYVDSPARLIQK